MERNQLFWGVPRGFQRELMGVGISRPWQSKKGGFYKLTTSERGL